MQEVDFNYVISHLEKEIKSLEEGIANDKDEDAALCRILANIVLQDRRELLGLVRDAVRTERYRRQGVDDFADAMIYSMSCLKDKNWFTDDFYKAMERAKGNMPPPPPKIAEQPTEDYSALIRSLENISWSIQRGSRFLTGYAYLDINKAISIIKSIGTKEGK